MRGKPVGVDSTAWTSLMAYMQAIAKGKAAKKPMMSGMTMTRGTLRPGLWISSHMWAPQSLPRKLKTVLTVARRKGRPLLDQPVVDVISANIHEAEAWLWRPQMKRTRVVVMRRVMER